MSVLFRQNNVIKKAQQNIIYKEKIYLGKKTRYNINITIKERKKDETSRKKKR